jgi:hypothetical protein
MTSPAGDTPFGIPRLLGFGQFSRRRKPGKPQQRFPGLI